MNCISYIKRNNTIDDVFSCLPYGRSQILPHTCAAACRASVWYEVGGKGVCAYFLHAAELKRTIKFGRLRRSSINSQPLTPVPRKASSPMPDLPAGPKTPAPAEPKQRKKWQIPTDMLFPQHMGRPPRGTPKPPEAPRLHATPRHFHTPVCDAKPQPPHMFPYSFT